MRQPVRAAIQFVIGKTLYFKGEGSAPTRPLDLPLKNIVNAKSVRNCGFRPILPGRQLFAFVRRQQGQFGNLNVGIACQSCEQNLKTLQQPLNGALIEKVSTIDELASQTFSQIPKICFQIQTRGADIKAYWVDYEVSPGEGRRNVLQ